MIPITFVYKKNKNLVFLGLQDALSKEIELKKQGYNHISTIDPLIVLSNIYDLCLEDYEAEEIIIDIIRLLIPEHNI